MILKEVGTVTLSLLGLYQYNEQLFDGLRLPSGVNKDTFVNNLLVETAEFEILYPDPEFMANMIAIWSSKELPVWEELEKTRHYDYDPISNYDRNEESTNIGESLGKVAGYNATDLVNSSGASTDVKRRARMWGNIGVTTTQQMINEQREVVKFNISDYIIDSFKRRFCLLIY